MEIFQVKQINFLIKKKDDISIIKRGDKILVEISKIKGKKISFKEYPSSFLFLPLDKSDKISSRNKKKIPCMTSKKIEGYLNKREQDHFIQNKGDLASYRIISFDHVKERMAFLNKEFDLDEKKKIIEGYYQKSDRIVKEFNCQFQGVREKNKNDLLK